ncbi:MAG TPA: DUF3054 domain-containing protein [Acidimicrobiales bacterium]|nr:DUF3054 domain-containing protein [Acidimicrobiales bacterium]
MTGAVRVAKPGASPRWAAAVIDVVVVVAFVAIGRASHHHAESVRGFLGTFWPFAAGLVAGWVVLACLSAGRLDGPPWAPETLRAGVAITVVTVAVGMVLRVIAGQGTAVPFVAVSLGFIGAFVLAGRGFLAAVARRRLAPHG